jgi:membrane associated rhomboid family serine protease
MIPIRDDIPSRTRPVVGISLIAINVLAFFYELTLGPESLEVFIGEYAVVPIRYFSSGDFDRFGLVQTFGTADLVIPVFTAMFLHGGWAHVGGNMLYLWIFGDNVEDRMGHGRFLIFYLLCGVLATAAHVFTNANSPVPSLGASGAIAGVLGAYLVLYPRARVVTLVPIFYFIQFIPIPAIILLGFWFLQQFFYGALSLGIESAQTGGVAWWAHIGGFVAGVVLINVFKRRDYYPAERDVWWEER